MLRIHNTLSGKKEEFTPADGKKVNMYVCGITPYDETHLGHARCYVVFDVIYRYLKYLGYEVRYVQNFTDIDDKIINRAKELNRLPKDIAEKYIKDFKDKMRQLNVKEAAEYPRVTEHIKDIVGFVEGLIEKGLAYEADGDVYYSVRKFPDYGNLSGRDVEKLKVGARIAPGEHKKDPLDFALWKKAKADEPDEVKFGSPWGRGRPGWHIECSVMSLKKSGTETLDIHGGGQDLIFPHHENEIAQSEGFTGKPFARFWVHNGFVTVNREKMSKSLGNFFSLGRIFEKYTPREVRWFLLGQHYRGPLDFSDEALEQSKRGLRSFEEKLGRVCGVEHWKRHKGAGDGELNERAAEFRSRFNEALENDFDFPAAISLSHAFVNFLNKSVDNPGYGEKRLREAATEFQCLIQKTLGIFLMPGCDLAVNEGKWQALVDERERARKLKNWAEADRLRGELEKSGIVIEDTSEGPRWWKKSGSGR